MNVPPTDHGLHCGVGAEAMPGPCSPECVALREGCDRGVGSRLLL